LSCDFHYYSSYHTNDTQDTVVNNTALSSNASNLNLLSAEKYAGLNAWSPVFAWNFSRCWCNCCQISLDTNTRGNFSSFSRCRKVGDDKRIVFKPKKVENKAIISPVPICCCFAGYELENFPFAFASLPPTKDPFTQVLYTFLYMPLPSWQQVYLNYDVTVRCVGEMVEGHWSVNPVTYSDGISCRQLCTPRWVAVEVEWGSEGACNYCLNRERGPEK